MGVMYNLHYLGFSWCWDLSSHAALFCLGFGFSAMPRGVWIDYGADRSVLLPVLQSVILLAEHWATVDRIIATLSV